MFLVISAILMSNPLLDQATLAQAEKMAHEIVILDGHIDLPYRLFEEMEDISVRTESGDFDYVRAKQGGLDAPFMSIYVPASMEDNGAKAHADKLIDMVASFVNQWPDKFALVNSVSDLEANFKKGLISLPMGMENGAPIEGDLANLKYFHDRGIRYITLTHSKVNHICDSSYDEERRWHGLSPFGKTVVVEMNRLGIMIDVAHISDETFFQVMELSTAPVIASHSSCRHFTPNLERNMSDDMIRLLAKKDGVIQINFGSFFINQESRVAGEIARKEITEIREQHEGEEAKTLVAAYRAANEFPRADIKDVIAHIEHVIQLVGDDHVGLGSDFDGVGDTLPDGLRDVSQYPNLIYEMLQLGYSQERIQKICSGNVIRVWRAVEKRANQAP